MDRAAVTSSNVKSVGHQGTDLEVEFKHGGVYLYRNVPAEVFERMMTAESIGKFIHSDIKPNYAHEKVGG